MLLLRPLPPPTGATAATIVRATVAATGRDLAVQLLQPKSPPLNYCYVSPCCHDATCCCTTAMSHCCYRVRRQELLLLNPPPAVARWCLLELQTVTYRHETAVATAASNAGPCCRHCCCRCAPPPPEHYSYLLPLDIPPLSCYLLISAGSLVYWCSKNAEKKQGW